MASRRSEQPPTLARLIHDRLPDNALRDDLGRLMQAIAESGKTIAREVNRAGLVDIMGLAGQVNVQGEEVAKLDLFTNDVVKRCLTATGLVCVMGSEEDPGPTPVTDSPGRRGTRPSLWCLLGTRGLRARARARLSS